MSHNKTEFLIGNDTLQIRPPQYLFILLIILFWVMVRWKSISNRLLGRKNGLDKEQSNGVSAGPITEEDLVASSLFHDKANIYSVKDTVDACKALNGTIEAFVMDVVYGADNYKSVTIRTPIQEDRAVDEVEKMMKKSLGEKLYNSLVTTAHSDRILDMNGEDSEERQRDAIQALTTYCICEALNTIVFGFKKRDVEDSEDTFRRMVEVGKYMVLANIHAHHI